MKSSFLFFLCILFCSVQSSYAQQKRGQPHDTKFSGYPSRDKSANILAEFKNPPKGYGNVPFFWWNGDTLSRERLIEQLDILKESATDGFAVSYIHSDPKGADYEFNKNGYGLYGRTVAGKPEIFSESWWKTWNWFSGEAAKRGMAAGLDDYTVGWVGNGYYPDDVRDLKKFKSYKGNLNIKVDSIKANQSITFIVPPDLVTLVAWPVHTKGGKKTFVDLKRKIKNGRLKFKAPHNTDWKIYTVTASANYMLHPDHGKELVRNYFQKFEDKLDDQGKKGMNYFFQDELFIPLSTTTWSEDFAVEFEKRKGYDVLPYLPALKEDIGAITAKIRLDYADVLMDLAEDRYFKPIYDWHSSRGLIYGSDNLGRGLEPLSYVDYFRVHTWYTAPGNDAPARGSSFIQTKVSSSVANLYKRPRTWLEAFHSMGWGSSGEWLTEQLDHHFIAGGNLICMHGLYYTTHGGWWEWAPPDFHFRMPYWPHMKKWLDYGERLSYIMSQGVHVSDIAIMYPTEPLQADSSRKPDVCFETAKKLSDAGLDYDFMDYRSLAKSTIVDGALNISDMSYKVLVIADMTAMHFASLKKMLQFYQNGGIVIAVGALPSASTNNGSNDPEVDAIVREVFGITASDLALGKAGVAIQTNAAGGKGIIAGINTISDLIAKQITPDFIPGEGGGKVLHRKVGDLDLYMTMNVKPGNICFFRTLGKPELWDAKTGQVTALPIVKQTAEGTYIRSEAEFNNSSIIMFSKGEPKQEADQLLGSKIIGKIPLGGDWDIEYLPTMDNKWGDFRLPASEGKIGTEARTFRFISKNNNKDKDWTDASFQDTKWEEGIYDYGHQMEHFVDSTGKDYHSLIKDALNGEIIRWDPYKFSWRFGLWDHPGPQGYHGLKGKVSDGFLVLDGAGSHLFRTNVFAVEDKMYRIVTGDRKPDGLYIDGIEVKDSLVRLASGWHSLLIGFTDVPKKGYKIGPNSRDDRPRSAVVFLPADLPVPVSVSPYSKTLAMRWYGANHLMFDPDRGINQKYCFRFTSAPGLEKMEMDVFGRNPKVWIDGKPLPEKYIQMLKSEKNLHTFRITLPEKRERTATVAMEIEREIGYQDVSIFPSPLKMFCRSGILKVGDWAETGQMIHYSGGLYYRKSITLTQNQLQNDLTLNLGDVVATCAISVNGKEVSTLITKPYKVNISKFLKAGTNEIEVLVYSTLSNHYQTIPSAYRGNPRAGLIGPVFIEMHK